MPFRKAAEHPFGNDQTAKSPHEAVCHGHRAESAVRDDGPNSRIPAGAGQRRRAAPTDSKDDQRQGIQVRVRFDEFEDGSNVIHFELGDPLDRRITFLALAVSLAAKVKCHNCESMSEQCAAIVSCHPVVAVQLRTKDDEAARCLTAARQMNAGRQHQSV